jgi:hypothetical protein
MFEVPEELSPPLCKPRNTERSSESMEKARAAMVPRSGPTKSFKSKAQFIRKFLSARANPDDPRSATRYVKMLENMFRIAAGANPQAAVAAFNALMDRAHGKPRPSEEEIDAIAKGGIQLVYVARPELDAPEKRMELTAPVPDFIEGEFTEEE